MQREAVTLREVTAETVRAVCKLKVAPSQENHVANNALSIAQAHFHGEKAWFRAIYAGEEPVGFLMLEVDVEKQEYFLWRMMVDERHQRSGFGRQAMELVFDHVRSLPGGTQLVTSHVSADDAAGPFYEKAGFTYTGVVEDGERVMVKRL